MSWLPPPRAARIVLVTGDGYLLGALPPLPVAEPWWQEVETVVQAVRAAHDLENTVLRLLSIDDWAESACQVTYVAETAGEVKAEPWAGTLDEHPLRLPYAEPGGPASDLGWADEVLEGHGFVRIGPAVQVRTWNLSSLWRIPVEGETLWLKVVPPFFAHEGALIEALAGSPVPEMLGYDGARILMREIPGVDGYRATLPERQRILDLLVELQTFWATRTEDLVRLGLPDWRFDSLAPKIDEVIARLAAELTSEERATLEFFTDGLAVRFADLASCGIPDTLVHGDLHPGNVRIAADRMTLLDWGDSGVGHPFLDQSSFFEVASNEQVEPLRTHWFDAWRRVVPGSDPVRAIALAAPVATARQVVTYQGFLDRIEPSEHIYHLNDPIDWLRRTALLCRSA